MDGSMGRGKGKGGELKGREKKREISSFIFCNISPLFVHHHPTHTTEFSEGAVTSLEHISCPNTYDVMVLLKCRCLLIWRQIILNQQRALPWNWIRGRFEFYISALLQWRNPEEIFEELLAILQLLYPLQSFPKPQVVRDDIDTDGL